MQGRLKSLRKEFHLSQEVLGRQIGLSQQVISRIEKDSSTMTLEHLILLADRFNVSTDYLLGRTETKRNLEGQRSVLDTLQENYELVQAFELLGDKNRELIWSLIEKMVQQETGNGSLEPDNQRM